MELDSFLPRMQIECKTSLSHHGNPYTDIQDENLQVSNQLQDPFLSKSFLLSVSIFSIPTTAQPRRTFCILCAATLASSSESDSLWDVELCEAELQGEEHSGEHRQCMRGRRYFPQKSTNLICLTQQSKQTPPHFGFGQLLAEPKYLRRFPGRSQGVQEILRILMVLAANSRRVGGSYVKSLTKRTTKGFPRKLNSSR